ncbi:unnamed protein product, partial [Candidula unifasciata]
FKYPSMLVSVMFVAGCVIYMVTVEFYVYVVNILDIVLDSVVEQLDKIGWHQQPDDSQGRILERDISLLVYNVAYAIKVSSIVSTTLAALVSFLNILHMMTIIQDKPVCAV